jgi:hypothetical protein
MPRVSHLAETLSMPGFIGYPSKNERQTAYGDGFNRPSPYGDLSLDIITPPTIVQPRLTTGRVLSAGATPMSDIFNYPKRRETPGVYPQSIPSSESGFSSNAETAIFPNPDPFPVMIGMLDAQITAMKQDEDARKAARRDLGKPPDASEIVERLKSPAELMFEEQRKKIDAGLVLRLQAQGFTDEEIAEFLTGRRRAAVAAAAERQAPDEDLVSSLARMQGGMPQTGTNAVGIGALSAARVRDGPEMTTPEMIAAAMSAMGTGGSVASLLQGASDPRAALSTAAEQEAAATGDPILELYTRGARDARREARRGPRMALMDTPAPPAPERMRIAPTIGREPFSRVFSNQVGGPRPSVIDILMGNSQAARREGEMQIVRRESGGGGGAAAGGTSIAARSLDREMVGGGLSKSAQRVKNADIRARLGAPATGRIPEALRAAYKAAGGR